MVGGNIRAMRLTTPVRADQQKECSDHNAGPSDRTRLHRLDQHGGRCGLHWLHRHRHAVKSSRQCVKQPEGRQNPGRGHADNGNRAHNVRQEGSKIAKRAENLPHTPAKARAGECRRLIGRLITANRDRRYPQSARSRRQPLRG